MGRMETAFAIHRLHPGNGDLTPPDFVVVLEIIILGAIHIFYQIIHQLSYNFIVSEGLVCLSVASGPLGRYPENFYRNKCPTGVWDRFRLSDITPLSAMTRQVLSPYPQCRSRKRVSALPFRLLTSLLLPRRKHP